MVYQYTPKGVCAKQIRVELDGSTIKSVQFTGGCNGNTTGISALVAGMNVKDAITRMRGIRCGFKPTSCPDQLAQALTEALEQSN